MGNLGMNVEQGNAHSPAEWFALRVKSRREKVVAVMARNRGFEEFVPLYESRRRWSDRFSSVSLPLLPGYVFCRLAVERRLPLLTIPGVLHFVGIGRTPVPITESEIAAIQAAVNAGLRPEPWPYLEAGQRVQLEEGPLAGLEGLLIETRKQHRIVVSVSLLKRSVAVEIDRSWVRPLDSQRQDVPLPISSPLVAKALSI
jgi:transcription antitermination factor NusG